MITSQRLNLWCELVEEYTMRRLTNASDRGIAIDGLATELYNTDAGLGTYVWGFFQYRFLEQLFWTRYLIDQPPELTRLEEMAPSWSWWSIHQPISWDERSWLQPNISGRRLNAIATVILENAEAAESESAMRKALHISASCVSAIIPEDAILNYGQCRLRLEGTDEHEEVETYFPNDVDITARRDKSDLEVCCANFIEELDEDGKVHKRGSLILIRSADDGRYGERIGCDTQDIPLEWYNAAETRSLVIC